MNKNYKMPINLFLILEKALPALYTSYVLQNNHFTILLEKKYLKLIMNIIKNDCFF
jgi:hypothetical protein